MKVFLSLSIAFLFFIASGFAQLVDPCGAIGMVSLNFHPDKPGFIKYDHDFKRLSELGSSIPYEHAVDLGDVLNLPKLDKHHSRYPLSNFGTFTPAGVQREPRNMDDPSNLAPGVVYVSGSKPWLGANFYTRCPEPLTIRPTWTFEAGGVTQTIRFPKIPVVPKPIPASAGGSGGQIYLASYPYNEAQDIIPQGFTLAFEAAEIVFSISDIPSGPLSPSMFSSTLRAECDIHVVANTPTLTSTTKGGRSLKPRYTSIRNGCVHGHDTDSYEDWIENTFNGYFKLPGAGAHRGRGGIPLEYWPLDSRAYCETLEQFFETGNGRCGLFSAYLSEMVICQGYPQSTDSEMILGASGTSVGPMGQINPISSGERSRAEAAIQQRFGLRTRIQITYLNNALFAVLKGSPFMVDRAYRMTPNTFGGIQDAVILGAMPYIVPGQNNILPRHLFQNHVVFISEPIVSPGGALYKKLYDPSYGVSYPHLVFPGPPPNNDLHGVRFLENDAVQFVRAYVANVRILITGRIVPVFVPLNENIDKLELFTF